MLESYSEILGFAWCKYWPTLPGPHAELLSLFNEENGVERNKVWDILGKFVFTVLASHPARPNEENQLENKSRVNVQKERLRKLLAAKQAKNEQPQTQNADLSLPEEFFKALLKAVSPSEKGKLFFQEYRSYEEKINYLKKNFQDEETIKIWKKFSLFKKNCKTDKHVLEYLTGLSEEDFLSWQGGLGSFAKLSEEVLGILANFLTESAKCVYLYYHDNEEDADDEAANNSSELENMVDDSAVISVLGSLKAIESFRAIKSSLDILNTDDTTKTPRVCLPALSALPQAAFDDLLEDVKSHKVIGLRFQEDADFNDLDVARLSKLLPYLVELDLSNVNPLTNKLLGELAVGITSNAQKNCLVELDLTGFLEEKPSLPVFLRTLGHFKRMKTLRLTSCELTSDDMKALGENFDSTNQLENLHLNENCIGNDGLFSLAELTKKLSKLVKLDLESNDYLQATDSLCHSTGLVKLFEAILVKPIKDLDISNPKVEITKTNEHIETFSFADSFMGDICRFLKDPRCPINFRMALVDEDAQQFAGFMPNIYAALACNTKITLVDFLGVPAVKSDVEVLLQKRKNINKFIYGNGEQAKRKNKKQTIAKPVKASTNYVVADLTKETLISIVKAAVKNTTTDIFYGEVQGNYLVDKDCGTLERVYGQMFNVMLEQLWLQATESPKLSECDQLFLFDMAMYYCGLFNHKQRPQLGSAKRSQFLQLLWDARKNNEGAVLALLMIYKLNLSMVKMDAPNIYAQLPVWFKQVFADSMHLLLQATDPQFFNDKEYNDLLKEINVKTNKQSNEIRSHQSTAENLRDRGATEWTLLILGVLYHGVYGIRQNKQKSLYYLEKAADYFNPLGSFFLAVYCQQPEAMDVAGQQWLPIADLYCRDPNFAMRVKNSFNPSQQESGETLEVSEEPSQSLVSLVRLETRLDTILSDNNFVNIFGKYSQFLKLVDKLELYRQRAGYLLDSADDFFVKKRPLILLIRNSLGKILELIATVSLVELAKEIEKLNSDCKKLINGRLRYLEKSMKEQVDFVTNITEKSQKNDGKAEELENKNDQAALGKKIVKSPAPLLGKPKHVKFSFAAINANLRDAFATRLTRLRDEATVRNTGLKTDKEAVQLKNALKLWETATPDTFAAIHGIKAAPISISAVKLELLELIARSSLYLISVRLAKLYGDIENLVMKDKSQGYWWQIRIILVHYPWLFIENYAHISWMQKRFIEQFSSHEQIINDCNQTSQSLFVPDNEMLELLNMDLTKTINIKQLIQFTKERWEELKALSALILQINQQDQASFAKLTLLHQAVVGCVVRLARGFKRLFNIEIIEEAEYLALKAEFQELRNAAAHRFSDEKLQACDANKARKAINKFSFYDVKDILVLAEKIATGQLKFPQFKPAPVCIPGIFKKINQDKLPSMEEEMLSAPREKVLTSAKENQMTNVATMNCQF